MSAVEENARTQTGTELVETGEDDDDKSFFGSWHSDSDSATASEDSEGLDLLACKEREAEVAALLPKVPRNEDGDPTSVGSYGHPETCSPCIFAFSPAGCIKGVRCRYCHFRHRIFRSLHRLKPERNGKRTSTASSREGHEGLAEAC
eukprot:TRINITY_DN113943_c0_g1_i1.p1 TRINITY_DN113943_c0_g1~~TRINITY_DN113943_c0_g1_i1.p1  ORF type:complete len:154 (-),score=15.31 TRINITY_DN113943_c0_g1_i1:25-465(-)